MKFKTLRPKVHLCTCVSSKQCSFIFKSNSKCKPQFFGFYWAGAYMGLVEESRQ